VGETQFCRRAGAASIQFVQLWRRTAFMSLSFDIPPRRRGLSQGRLCLILGLALAVVMLALLPSANAAFPPPAGPAANASPD